MAATATRSTFVLGRVGVRAGPWRRVFEKLTGV